MTFFLILIVGFFLVQIFLKLYRYNMELASFYLAIADALRIAEMEGSGIQGVKFNELVQLLTPGNISLETPESPKVIDFSGLLGKKM